MWNLEKCTDEPHFECGNRDADVQKEQWTRGEGQGGMNWRVEVDIYARPWVKQS